MDYKTKIKVAAVIGVVIIAIIFIIMIVFVKNNNTNTNIPTKTQSNTTDNNSNGSETEDDKKEESTTLSLDSVSSLAIKDEYLVKVNNDVTSENIIKLEDSEDKKYIDYTYSNSKAYLLYKEVIDSSEKLVVYSLDLLKSNYPTEKILVQDEYNYGKDLTFANDKIYYITLDNNIFEYSIAEEAEKDLLDNTFKVSNGSLKIDSANNIAYFIASENSELGIYKMNLGTNERERIINGFSTGYDLLLKDKYLVCNVDNTNYLYNSENNSIWEVGANVNSEDGHGATNKIAFYETQFVIYTNEKKIVLKDFDGNVLNESLYAVSEDKETISSVSMITENKLQIVLENDGNYEKSIIIDLSEGLLSENTDNYKNIINIK